MEAISFTFSDMAKRPESEKKVNIAARINPKLLAALESLAAAEERTLSFLVEKAIGQFVEKRAKPAPRSRDR